MTFTSYTQSLFENSVELRALYLGTTNTQFAPRIQYRYDPEATPPITDIYPSTANFSISKHTQMAFIVRKQEIDKIWNDFVAYIHTFPFFQNIKLSFEIIGTVSHPRLSITLGTFYLGGGIKEVPLFMEMVTAFDKSLTQIETDPDAPYHTWSCGHTQETTKHFIRAQTPEMAGCLSALIEYPLFQDLQNDLKGIITRFKIVTTDL
jgi:hypothetical protein